MSAPTPAAEGVTNPSIDDLLTKTDSKYQLVLYSAKRARQINAYYSQLGEGLLDLDRPVAQIVPWLAANPGITPAQLISNSSGLVGLGPNPSYPPYLCQFVYNSGTL